MGIGPEAQDPYSATYADGPEEGKWAEDFWKQWAASQAPRNPHEAVANTQYANNDGWGLGNEWTARGGGKGAAAAYMDRTASGNVIARLGADLARVEGRQAPQAATVGIGQQGYAQAAKVGPASQYAGASLNMSDDAAVRAQQGAMMQSLADRAAGRGVAPGVAQLQANLDKSLANMTSATAATRARNTGMAARGLAIRSAQAQQGAVGDANILRAQDQQQAAAAMAGLAGSMRQGDFAGAEQAAALRRQAGMFNADAQNKNAMAQAGMNQNTSMFNAQANQKQTEMNQDVYRANSEAQMRMMGMNDAAIAQRLGMTQDQYNRQKANSMEFWQMATGQRKKDNAFQFQKDQDDAMARSQQYAAAASAVGSMSDMYQDREKKEAAAASTTSDRRQKKNIQPGNSVIDSWLAELGGSR